MNITKLQEAYNAKIAEAKALANGDVTPEISDKISGLLGETDQLKVQIDMAKRLADAEAHAAEPMGTKAAHHGGVRPGRTRVCPPSITIHGAR